MRAEGTVMYRAFLFSSVLVLSGMALVGCSDRTANPPSDPSITVLPFRNPILAGDTVTLFASLEGGDNSTIRWEMIAGPSDYGSITPQGLYTSPRSIVEDSIFVRVKAAAPSTSRTATVTIVVARGEFRHQPPGVGSTFTNAYYLVDSAGRKVAGSDRQSTQTLVTTTASIGGHDNVAIFAGPRDSTIISYLPAGDIQIGRPAGSGVVWNTLNFGTRASATEAHPDLVLEGGVKVSDTTSTAWVGQEVIPVGTKSFIARKMRAVTVRTVSGSANYTERIVEDVWYAGAVGTIVRIDRTIEHTEGGNTTIRGEKQTMINCELH